MTMPEKPRQNPIAWLMLAILAWSVILASGVLLYDYWNSQINVVKPIVIVVTTLAMIGAWSVALRSRRSRAEPRGPQN